MKYIYLLFNLFLLIALTNEDLNAQTYLPDPSFQSPVIRQFASVNTYAEQKDGKVIMYGFYEYINNDPITGLARLNVDRTLDSSFKTSIQLKGGVTKILVQPDRKIVIIGSFTWLNGVTSTGIIRLNDDGSLDDTFQVGTGVIGAISDAVLQPDGKIIIVGPFSNYNGYIISDIARLNADGTLDSNFKKVILTSSAIPDATIERIRVQKDGKLCVIGNFGSINGVVKLYIARLNADGSLDEGFASTRSFITPYNIELQSDGKVILGGFIHSTLPGLFYCGLIRLDTDGNVDASYNTAGIAKYDYIFNMTIQSDDKIVVSSLYEWMETQWQFGYIIRVNTNGTLDNTFLYPIDRISFAENMLTLSNDKLLLGGVFGLNDNKYLLQLNTNGSTDDITIPEIEIRGGVNTFISHPDREIIATGQTTEVNGKKVNRYFRIDSDGELDSGFNPDKNIIIITVQADGKILGIEGTKIVRLNADGTYDNSFSMHPSVFGNYRDIVIQQDNKIVISAVSSGSITHPVIRLNADGSIDNSFTSPPIHKSVFNLLLQQDGKILAKTDQFTVNNGVPTLTQGMMRINIDGTIDNSFLQGECNCLIKTVAVQPNGQIVLGGEFREYNGYASENIIRLNKDGSVDDTFKAGKTIKFNQAINKLLVHSNGKILVQGNFTTVDQIASNGLVQLNEDGTLDDTFGLGISNNERISATALQTDGKILVSISDRILKYFTPQEQVIDFSSISDKQVDDSPFQLKAIASSGLPVSFMVVSGPATITGNILTLTGEPGFIKVIAMQEGNVYYKAALLVERTFEVQAIVLKEQSIEFAAIDDKIVNDNPFKLIATANSNLPVIFSVISGPATILEDTLHLTGEAGSVTISASQLGNTYYKAAPDVERTFAVKMVLGLVDNTADLVKIYPNPTSKNFTVELSHKLPIEKMQLLNMQGTPVTGLYTNMNISVEVNTQFLSPGIYIVYIISNDQEIRRKVVLY